MIPWWVAVITLVVGANLGLFTLALLRAADHDAVDAEAEALPPSKYDVHV